MFSGVDSELDVGTVHQILRYPVKSMRGEAPATAFIDEFGVEGDRRFALVDTATGKVASAKRPQLWRELLHCEARCVPQGVQVRLADGSVLTSSEADVDLRLSRYLQRDVALRRVQQAAGLELERARPEEVLENDIAMPAKLDVSRIGRASPPGSFFDYAPLHLLTTGSLAALRDQDRDDVPFEAARYRPNLVIDTGPRAGFIEDEWIGRELSIGSDLRVRIIIATPRCSIPMLAQGPLPMRREAFAILLARHRLALEDIGTLPCLGVYAQVLRRGHVQAGDRVRVSASKVAGEP